MRRRGKSSRGVRVFAVLFWVYAVVLFVGLHWPQLRLPEGSPPRSDLAVHVVAFGVWASLLILSGLVGVPARLGTSVRAAVVGVAYAGVDELLQGVPMVKRHAAWDDFGANAAGVLIACAVFGVLCGVRAGRCLRCETMSTARGVQPPAGGE